MSSVEPDEHANQQNSSHKSLGQFVVTGGDTTILLEFSEKPLDEIALAIEREIGLARLFAVGFRRDHGGDAAGVERIDEPIGVVALVGKHGSGVDLVEQGFGLRDIG